MYKRQMQRVRSPEGRTAALLGNRMGVMGSEGVILKTRGWMRGARCRPRKSPVGVTQNAM